MANRKSNAEKNFVMWHDKDPRKYRKASEDALDYDFACIGRAENIHYNSDKWAKDGTDQSYVHDFDTRPKVWVPLVSVDNEEIIGTPRKGYGLLGLRTAANPAHVAQLALAEDLTYADNEGSKRVLGPFRNTPLFSSHDRKALLILRRRSPIIIRGGDMRVTARGIVK
ncbi:MAG: hypothetical protein ACPGWS_07620 [Solirubrobacterales bacterium]